MATNETEEPRPPTPGERVTSFVSQAQRTATAPAQAFGFRELIFSAIAIVCLAGAFPPLNIIGTLAVIGLIVTYPKRR